MGYYIEKQYEGCYLVIDEEDSERVARVARFEPGPMVSIKIPHLLSPAMAKAVAAAMVELANDLDAVVLEGEEL